jgi:putative ABC transport system permease protein
MRLAIRLALRELRGGTRGLRLVLACLALGVAVIAGVGELRAAMAAGLAADGARILGGDIEVESGSDPLPDALRDWLRGRAARISDVVETRSMLVAPSGERQLVELKAVDPAWPLIGTAATDPPGAKLSGVWADPVVLDRLRVHPGDTLRLGDARLPLTAALTSEPDRVAGTSLAPRALIPLDELPATHLVVPGSFVNYAVRAVLPPEARPEATIAALRAAFPGTGWRIRDRAHAAAGLDRFVDQTGQFLTLVGLTALLVGGIGVANGVRAWLEARTRTIATLRCLGASAGLVFSIALIEVMALAAGGVAIGLVAGAVLPDLGLHVLGNLLPLPARPGFYPRPLLLAAAFGLLTAAAFALWPLGRAGRIGGAALFRIGAPLPPGPRPARLLAVNALLILLLVALTALSSPDRALALGFCAAAALALVLFRLAGFGVMRLARAGRRIGAPAFRLGLGNLYRPGAATPLMLASVGLGLSTLAAITLIQGNLRDQIFQRLPEDAPSLFFIDIQDSELARFEQIARATPGVTALAQVPSLRARVVSLNGIPAEQIRATPDTSWALRGDRGLTYAASPPAGTEVVSGAWWPPGYDGAPLLSFDAGLAEGWGMKVGDTLRVSVLGRDVDLKVANLRKIAWQSLGLNFTMVASPGLLSHAPHTHIATVHASAAATGALLRAETDALPNITGIPVSDVLRAVADLLARIGTALAATGSLALVSGVLVLAGAVASGQRRRIQDAVVLKALGATRGQLRLAWLAEFGALGLAAGLIAALVGSLASFAVMHYVMHADWAWLPARLAGTILACVLLMLGFGYVGTALALRSSALPWLRNE